MPKVQMSESTYDLPDPVITPEQFFPSQNFGQPEKRLMLAVLEDALHCLIKNLDATQNKKSVHRRRHKLGDPKRLAKEAREWILSEDETWLFSFNRICEALDIDGEYLRAGILRYMQQKSSLRKKTKLPHSAGRYSFYRPVST